jgi:hypothetical protein
MKDVSDWIDAGGTREQLLEFVRNTPVWTPPSENRNGGSSGRTMRLAWKRASAIVPTTFQWLDRPYFAQGELQGIAGDGGLGKSTLSHKMAADISRGRTRTGEPTHPQTVILVSAEDAEHKVRSNLELLDADLENTIVVSGMFDEVIGEEGDVEGFLIDEVGVAALDDLVAHVHPAAVFIDPIAETIPFSVDSHKAPQVRLVLARLRRLARKQHCAVIYLIHLSKPGGHAERAQHRVQMSEAFVSAARSMVMINRHPEDEGQRVITHAKTNLAEYGPSLACSFSAEEGWRWRGVVDVSADASFVPSPEKESGLVDAIIWLVRYHRKETRPAREVIAEARSRDIEEHTLRRAYQRLGGKGVAVHEKGKRGVVGWDWPAVLRTEKDDDDVQRAAVSSKALSSKYSGVQTPNYLDDTHLDYSGARSTGTAVPHAPSDGETAHGAERGAEDVKDSAEDDREYTLTVGDGCSECAGQDPQCWFCSPLATPADVTPNGKGPGGARVGQMCQVCYQILLPSGCACPRGDDEGEL